MPSLRELQSELLGAVLDGASARAEALVCASSLDARRRLAVYANNARAHFRAALASSYPVLQRLVGADYFAQTAQRFQRHSPSRSGDLTSAGAEFAAFLRVTLPAELGYLAEVARLEWLVQEAALAADAAPFDLRRLAALPVSAYDALRWRLQPSARLFISSFPCVAIWQANVDFSQVPAIIDLDAAGCSVVLARIRGQLMFQTVADGELYFLQAVANGLSFAAAIEAATVDPNFDAATALAHWLQSEILVACT